MLSTSWKDSAFDELYALLARLPLIECSRSKKDDLQLRLLAVLRALMDDGTPFDVAEKIRELAAEVEGFGV